MKYTCEGCAHAPYIRTNNFCTGCGKYILAPDGEGTVFIMTHWTAKKFTNYEVYFGTQERAMDSLSLLLEWPDHPRKEVREFQKEVHDMGVIKWLESECKNRRWYSHISI